MKKLMASLSKSDDISAFKNAVIRACALVSGISGIIILISVLYPIALYQAEARQKYPDLLDPIQKGSRTVKEILTSDEIGVIDYTKASNWFADPHTTNFESESKVSHYTISVPKLGIENASTLIGGEDLSENLIHYPGTALPGRTGNAVIFGHSILPQFYNPKNYLAIFSTLPTLEKGDEINVEYDGVSYKYLVTEMFEVLPTDLTVLDQEEDDSYISLVTCTPPGHPLKPRRLVVKARVVPPDIYANTWN